MHKNIVCIIIIIKATICCKTIFKNILICIVIVCNELENTILKFPNFVRENVIYKVINIVSNVII